MRNRRVNGQTSSAAAATAASPTRPLQDYHLSGDDYSQHIAVRRRPQTLEELYGSYPYLFSSVYLRVMDSLPAFVQSFALPEALPQWDIMLGRLRTNHVRPYDGTKPEDVLLLQQLWTAHSKIVFRADAPFTPIDPTWKEMGFQDTDPAKDFRGGGRLSLEQLIYFAEHYPADWDRMLGGDYLLAAAGINVTLRLMALLGIGQGKIAGPSTAAQAHTRFTTAKAKAQVCHFLFDENINRVFERLNEVYCAILRLLFRRWEASSKNIMEFNAILTRVYVEAERLLYMCESLEEFKRFL